MKFQKYLALTLLVCLLSTIFSDMKSYAEEKNMTLSEADLESNTIVESSESSVSTEEAQAIDSLLSVIESTYGLEKQKYIVRLKPAVLESKNFATSAREINQENLVVDTSEGLVAGNNEGLVIEQLDIINSVVMELSTSQVEDLMQQESVEFIEPDQEISIANETQELVNNQVIESSSQLVPWGIYSTGAYAVNALDSKGERIGVAVFDTGISNHAELSIKDGVSFVTSNESYIDDNGHGTQIAGTIAAADDLKGIVGSTSNVDLYAVKVIDARGQGNISSVIQGIEWAINNEVDIINLSFVSSNDSELLHEAVQIAKENGILVIAAAGNSGEGINTIKFPAKYPEVIAVGAIDQAHRKSIFSSTGPELDIVAPGTNILTTNKHGGYSVTSGTSIAAAHVTGAAALLWSKDRTKGPDEIATLLTGTSTNLGDVNEYGLGLVNIAKAIGITANAILPLTNESIINEENIWIPSEDGELNIASYDQTGDGQVITAGETAAVSVKLNGDQNGENIHEKIIIEVYPRNEPENIISTKEIEFPNLNEVIEYLWTTSVETVPGTYNIKFRYPARPTGVDDDIFIIYVEGMDHPSPSDLITVPSGNSIKLSWTPPKEAVSYSLLLNGVFISNSANASYTFNNLEPLTQYKLAVAAHYQDGIISSYSEITSSTIIQELIVFTPIDVKQQKPSQLFIFHPAATGVYRFNTSANGQTGEGSDTQLTIYSDSALTKQINSNDEFEGSSYSQIKQSLTGGETYYIKLSAFGEETLQARIVADVISSTIPYIQENQSIDIDEQNNNSTVYIFVPTQSGKFNINTNFYSGNPVSRENDTQISIFTDVNLITLLPDGYNDDTFDSVFSEVGVTLTQAVPYFIKVSGFDNSKVYARLLVTKKEQIPVLIDNRVPINISKSIGEYEILKFIPELSGTYRLFTSASPEGLDVRQDTQVTLYSDSSLNNRLATNDDAEGSNPYGALYSKLDYSLTAGITYYISVKNLAQSEDLKVRFTIEDSLHSSKQAAQQIEWNNLIEIDGTNRNLSITSLYDVDYFVLNLTEDEQVNINIGKATGLIENSNGRIYGYFSEKGESVFELTAGTYYLKIKNDILGKTRLLEYSLFNQFEYYLGVYINEMDYNPEEATAVPSLARASSNTTSKSFDATPTSKGVKFNYKNKIDTNELLVDIYPRDAYYMKAHSKKYTSQKKNNSLSIEWKGDVTSNRDVFANRHYFPGYTYDGGYIYWAKNGQYRIEVTPKDNKNHRRVYYVNVSNDALNEYNWVPVPPKKDSDGTKVTRDNKQSCEACKNYYYRYVLPIDSPAPETGYVTWSREIYGKNGIEKFWAKTEKLIYDEKKSVIDNIQGTIELIGFIPVLGAPADGVNAVVYLIRGDNVQAAISAVSLIPIVEVAAYSGKKIAGLKKYDATYAKAPCNCFAEGTVVVTDKGNKKIEDIKIGDLVLAKDEKTGMKMHKPVEYLFEKETNELYIITAGGKEIATTYNHPFWIKDKGWVDAENLDIGDQLISSDNSLILIDAIEIKMQETKVYNLTVKDYHTFFATELEVYTHNLVCNINSYSGTLPTTKTTTGGKQDSTILANELEKHNIKKPPLESGITGWAAHHIVPASENRFYSAKEARRIMEAAGIYKNSVANGVWLPIKKGDKTTEFIDENTQVMWKAAAHNGSHAKRYYDYVLEMIEDYEGDQAAILFQMHKIREKLLDGTLTLGRL